MIFMNKKVNIDIYDQPDIFVAISLAFAIKNAKTAKNVLDKKVLTPDTAASILQFF